MITRRRILLAAILFILSLTAARANPDEETRVLCIHDKPFRVSVTNAADPHLMLNFCGLNSAAQEMSYQKAKVRLRLSQDPATVQLNAGNYTYVDPWVRAIASETKLTKTPPKAVKAELLVFNSEWLDTAEIVLVMQRDGLVPATLEDLIALGAERPELQEQYHIVAFGTGAIDPADPTTITFPVLGAVDGQHYLTRIKATQNETLWPYNLRLYTPPALLAKMGGERLRALELAYGETPPMAFAFLAVPAKKTKSLEFKTQ